MKYKVLVANIKGEEFEGWFELEELENMDDISLSFIYAENNVSKVAGDYFTALCRIREELEKQGVTVICNGASKDVYPSPMMRDMGDGDQAYRLKIGVPAKMADVVNIFEVDRDNFIPSTVLEQEEFYQEWLKIKKNSIF